METTKSTVTQQILNLTLEILYLLTGEDYILVKKPSGQTPHKNRLQVVEGICRSWGNVLVSSPSGEDNELKILDLTYKVIELLTREVPIRCQDVAVYFSMEEWEYVEGHKDLYRDAMVDDPQNPSLPDGPVCSNSPVPNAPSDLVNGDDIAMDTDSETETLKSQNPGDVEKTEETSGCENGDLSDVDHTSLYSCLHIKEEPCEDSWDGEDLRNTAPHLAGQLHIKEEPDSCDEEENLINPNNYPLTQHHIKEEPTSRDGQNLTQPSMDASTVPAQYIVRAASWDGQNLTQLYMDASTAPTCDRGNLPDSNVYKSTDYTPQHQAHFTGEPASPNGEDAPDTTLHSRFVPIHIKKEPDTCEDYIPTKIRRYPKRQSSLVKHGEPALRNGRRDGNKENPVKEAPAASAVSEQPQEEDNTETNNSSSVYSVRQSADTMEILYHCPSCHKGFNSNLDLARHQVIHTVDKLFICSLCGKSFTELSFLVKHQVIHTDLKLCVCQVCGGCFYSETSLAKHQKTHSLPSHCNTCGKCFFDKTELEIHKRKHTGERPFPCHLCGKQFIAKSVLTKHMLTHTAPEHLK